MFPHPLPWYIAGPLIGLVVPALLLLGNKPFGVSSNFRHLCALLAPGRIDFLRYDWRGAGGWNLAFLAGILAGGWLAWQVAPPPAETLSISPATIEALRGLGLTDFTGLATREIFDWAALATLDGVVILMAGGFLIGFGTAYAGGCTSGHAIAGLASGQVASLLAVCGFFAGGLAGSYWLLPALLR
jgi:uncharacterized membrane protein YedE/YeeE